MGVTMDEKGRLLKEILGSSRLIPIPEYPELSDYRGARSGDPVLDRLRQVADIVRQHIAARDVVVDLCERRALRNNRVTTGP